MKNQRKFAIIADDYTGAGDSGIHFSRAGGRTDLLLQQENVAALLWCSSHVSLTTESRFLGPVDAASKVAAAVLQCQRAGFKNFFKKIDSTLRGNPGAEIESALHSTGRTAALICTAMPTTGRTCVDGDIYLDGVPLHLTEIGQDPFTPLSTSSVAQLLGEQTALPVGAVSLGDIEAGDTELAAKLTTLIEQGCRLIIADAVTESHLLALARQIDVADFLPVGAGGFAKALAATWKHKGEGDICPDADVQAEGPILAVIGSLAGISGEQGDQACLSGHFRPFDIMPEYGPEDIERKLSLFFEGLGQTRANILLRVSAAVRPGKVTKKEGERVAQLLGEAAARICRRYDCKTVFSTGGSTSMGVARALGVKVVTLVEEMMPGVVLGSCSAPDTDVQWFISKAGGFGDKEILQHIAAGSTDSTQGETK